MTFGPIVEKIAFLPDNYLPELDKFVDKLVARANKDREDELDRALEDVRAGHTEPLNLEEHFRMVENVCAEAQQGL